HAKQAMSRLVGDGVSLPCPEFATPVVSLENGSHEHVISDHESFLPARTDPNRKKRLGNIESTLTYAGFEDFGFILSIQEQRNRGPDRYGCTVLVTPEIGGEFIKFLFFRLQSPLEASLR